MKKILNSAIAVVILSTVFVGCDLNKEQKISLAQNAGLIAATTWVSVDNPTVEDMANLANVMVYLQRTLGAIKEGENLSVSLYPIAQKFIREYLEPESQALALSGTVVLLTALDLYFAKNPAEKQSEMIMLAGAFMDGAKSGLQLAPQSQMMSIARYSYQLRFNALQSNVE